MSSEIPTLRETDDWFETKVIPQRTTSSGFSLNRVWKTPRSTIMGNTSDPNGLCGDASLFVFDSFEKAFPKTYRETSDGYMMGLVLWEGTVLNHIANVMLPKKQARMQVFVTKGTGEVGKPSFVEGRTTCYVPAKPSGMSAKELAGLRVYDLYYKKKTNIEDWWKDLDSMGGMLSVGLEHEFA